MRRPAVLMLALALLAGACSPDDSAATTTTSTTTTSSTTLTTTTLAPTTTTTSPPPTTTTTAAPTTTASQDPPPAKVTGVSAGLSGGSEEIFVSWDASAAADLDHYNIYFSVDPGASKTLLVMVPGTETDYIDYPRDLTEGINCYQVSAVDGGGHEGQRSDEACFSAS